MKIASAIKYPLKNNYNNPTQSFAGKRPCSAKGNTQLLGFDIDGTVGLGDSSDLKEFKSLISADKNLKLTYVTGQSLESFLKNQNKDLSQNMNLPMPAYIITSNGTHIYKRTDDGFAIDQKWEKTLDRSTFNLETIKNNVEKIGDKNGGFTTIEQVQEGQVRNYKVMRSPRGENAYNIQFLVAEDSKDKIIKEITKLKKRNQRFEIVTDYIEPDLLKDLPEDYKKNLAPLMDKKGGIHSLFILPSNKAKALTYLAHKLQIPKKNIIAGGNGENDISLLKFMFIMVKNAHEGLKKASYKFGATVFEANFDGLKGILEGLRKIAVK